MYKNDNYVSLQVVDDMGRPWCLILLYGHSVLQFRENVWNSLSMYISSLSFPYNVMGDFNQVMHPNEKWSLTKKYIQGMVAGNNFINKCGLIY